MANSLPLTGQPSTTATKLEALLAVQSKLEDWNGSPSRTGDMVEKIPPGHPLHSAVVVLESHYGGRLPRPARADWKTLLKLADDEEGAEKAAERLRKWVQGELDSAPHSSIKKRPGRKKANYDTERR